MSFFGSSGDLICLGDSGSDIRSGNDVNPFGDNDGDVRVVSV